MTAIKAGRDVIERGRAAGDDVADALGDVRDALDDFLARTDGVLARFDRSRRPGMKLPLAIAAAGLIAGYVIGRRSSQPETLAQANAAGSPPAEPTMDVTTAVNVSRPQAAELDEIVPENGATADTGAGSTSTNS